MCMQNFVTYFLHGGVPGAMQIPMGQLLHQQLGGLERCRLHLYSYQLHRQLVGFLWDHFVFL